MSNLATFREAGRVGSKFFNLAPGRVGSGQGPGGSGRVGSEKSDPRPTLRQLPMRKCRLTIGPIILKIRTAADEREIDFFLIGFLERVQETYEHCRRFSRQHV